MIKKLGLTSSLAVASAMFLAVGAAQAATLTFDSVDDCTTAEVTITGGNSAEACGLDTSPNGTSALYRPELPDTLDSYWTAEFAMDVSNVSIDLGDFGVDADRLFLWAWGEALNVIGFTELSIAEDVDTMQTLSLMISRIRWITFGTIGAHPDFPEGLGLGGIRADNLTYTSSRPSEVPIPAALPLMLTGLGALGLAGWRKKRKAAA